MSSAVPAALPVKSANTYLLVSRSGGTKITYYPKAPGPPVKGVAPGPLLKYAGPEGDLNFHSTQITRQETPSGTLLSVVLQPPADAGSLSYSLFLPAVDLGSTQSQPFTTCAVKAKHAELSAGLGAQITYETEDLSGDANFVFLPR